MDVGLDHRGVGPQPVAAGHPPRAGDVDEARDDALERLRSQQGRQADQRLGIRDPFAVDAAEGAVDQAAADFPLALGEAPVIEVLEDQHPEDHDHGRAQPTAGRALGPAAPEGGVDEVDDCLIVEDGVDPAQVVVPELVAVGQQHFDEAALQVGAPDHGSSAEADGFHDGCLGISRAAVGAGHRVPARSAAVLARPPHPCGSRPATPAEHKKRECARRGRGSSGRDGDHASAPLHSGTPAGRSGGRSRRGCQTRCGGRAGGAAAGARPATAEFSSPMPSVTILAWITGVANEKPRVRPGTPEAVPRKITSNSLLFAPESSYVFSKPALGKRGSPLGGRAADDHGRDRI